MSTIQDIEYSIKEADNPNSLVNKTTTAISQRIAVIPDEILLMEEEALEVTARVGKTETRLRIAWMIEFERALRTGKEMNPSNIYLGTCTKKYFYEYVVGNSYKLAYIIKPFPEFQIELEDILQLGLKRARLTLETNPVSEDGKFNVALAKLQHEITKDAMDRSKGQSVQKIESKSLNLNVTKDVSPTNMDEIDARLAQLEGREVQQIQHEPKDVRPR
ncbi:hypothetical protein D3C87_125090 [compost metagenome]